MHTHFAHALTEASGCQALPLLLFSRLLAEQAGARASTKQDPASEECVSSAGLTLAGIHVTVGGAVMPD